MKPTRIVRDGWRVFVGELGWRLSNLRSVSDRESKPFLEAFAAARERRLSAEEAEWLHRIDELEQDLKRSTQPITFYHYGLGAHDERAGRSRRADGGLVESTVGKIVTISLPGKWLLLLFRLIRQLQPVSCLELGTCLGLSALCQASALHLNGKGHLVTLEGAEVLAGLARENVGRLGLEQVEVVVGRFRDTLPALLEQRKPIDYAFIDGDHYEETTVAHYEQMRPYLSNGAILVFDDIWFSAGMRRAWKRISQSPSALRTFDLGRIGVCLFSPVASSHKNYRLGI